ncbi:MAG TPA: hypothetical protein GXX18_02375 [Bacillales bacterium]|nr:hypothetical protein [Bacillales bacterium]
MKDKWFNVLLFGILFLLLFATACNKETNISNQLIDVYSAYDKLDIEVSKPDNLFKQNGIEIVSYSIDDVNNQLVIGVLKLNPKIEKQFKKIFLNQILHGEVKYNISQEDRPIAE